MLNSSHAFGRVTIQMITYGFPSLVYKVARHANSASGQAARVSDLLL